MSENRLAQTLAGFGMDLVPVTYPESTRTAEDAATAIGCDVAQIAKSLIFQGKSSGKPVLVVASGANRVDEKRIRDLIGEKIGKADAGFVRAKTGFAIGGVPPVGHAEAPICVLDEDLRRHGVIWAAAGTPRTVFQLTPDQLARITEGRWAAVAKT
jgi:prolyl-tRNA editing enzyme YbaK/EbsC (Cys-tRNA(Pro) deacylase)